MAVPKEHINTTTLSPLIKCDLMKQETIWMPSQLSLIPYVL